MTTTTDYKGASIGGKPVNLSQLHAELRTAGVSVDGLGQSDDYVFAYDAEGLPTDFSTAEQPTVDQVIAAHVAMRDKTDAEYATEFQNPATTAQRKQEIRDILAGLMPREQVPVT